MKKYLAGVVIAAVMGLAQAAASESAAQGEPVSGWWGASLPDGVKPEQDAFKASNVLKKGGMLLVSRSTENLPRLTDREALEQVYATGKAPTVKGRVLGTVPKLKVLPCEEGCEGPDYERIVGFFTKGFRGDPALFEERGELVVQVRWFNERPWYSKALPYAADEFGVSFVMEGKLVSAGVSSGIAVAATLSVMARNLGDNLRRYMVFGAGVGARPMFLRESFYLGDGPQSVIARNAAKIHTTLGASDVQPRLEPLTEEMASRLPAIDGIKPGEVAPVTEVVYLKSF